VTREALEQKFDMAEGRMHTNYSFFLGATADNLHEIKRFYADGGRLVKLFMGSSTGGMLVTDDRALRALFDGFGGVIAAHCEDEGMIRGAIDLWKRQAVDAATAAIHPAVRTTEACYVSTARAVELADRYGTQLHVCHISSERELGLFAGGEFGEFGGFCGRDRKNITAEACVPHLWFADEDYARLGNRIKCNPAIKTAADRAALRSAVGGAGDYRGRIDLVATDHAPHTAAAKARGYGEAPSGIPSVQHSLVAMMELAAGVSGASGGPGGFSGGLTLTGIVEKMCHAPAVRFGLAGRGFLRQGFAADIAIVDPAFEGADGGAGWIVGPENILSKCGWSPWEGVRFGARVVCTIVGGRIAWDGERVADAASGRRLEFEN
jgi:dihydroorotase